MARFNYDDDIDQKAEQGGFVLVPEGTYPVRLKECVRGETTNHNECWKARMEITEGQWAGQEIRDTIVFSKAAQVRSYKFCQAFGAYLGKDLGEFIRTLDTDGSQDALVGRTAMVTVEHRKGTKPRDDGSFPMFANPTFAGYEPMGKVAAGPKTAAAAPAAAAGEDLSELPF